MERTKPDGLVESPSSFATRCRALNATWPFYLKFSCILSILQLYTVSNLLWRLLTAVVLSTASSLLYRWLRALLPFQITVKDLYTAFYQKSLEQGLLTSYIAIKKKQLHCNRIYCTSSLRKDTCVFICTVFYNMGLACDMDTFRTIIINWINLSKFLIDSFSATAPVLICRTMCNLNYIPL